MLFSYSEVSSTPSQAMDTWVFNNKHLPGLMLNSSDWKFLSEVADFLKVNSFFFCPVKNDTNEACQMLGFYSSNLANVAI